MRTWSAISTLSVLATLAIAGGAPPFAIESGPRSVPPVSPELLADAPLLILREGEPWGEIWPRADPLAIADPPHCTDRCLYGHVRPGQLAGAIRFREAWSDYRGSSVPAGTYLLSYMVQPYLKAHAGVSDWRDFLILTPSEEGGDAPAHPLVMALASRGKVGTFQTGDDQTSVTIHTGGIEMALVLEGKGRASEL